MPVSIPVRPMHVAVVDEELPVPLTSGKRIRSFHLVTRLARRHRITYLCHRNADPQEARDAAECLRDHGIEPIVVERVVPPRFGPWFYARLAANLLSPLPYSVASHKSRALRRAIHAFAAKNRVDLWQCEWTPYAEAVRGLVGACRLVSAHNVESLIWQRYYETEANGLKRWYIRRQWRKFERFEKRAFAEATRVVAVSPEDAALMRQRFGTESVEVVENGVDTTHFRPTPRPTLSRFEAAGQSMPPHPREPDRILFLGSLDWRPNLDALALMMERIFPAVKAEHPSARLCIVGRKPAKELVRRVQTLTNVELHADVADVRPYLARCGVLAVPLRVGGGSRLKILEALASGLPVVSSRVGAEGLALRAGRDLVVVEEWQEMSGALLHCIRNPEMALATAESGRRLVMERYDWDTLADKLEQIWAQCVSRGIDCQAVSGLGRVGTPSYAGEGCPA